ncbi:MAG: hypothetical protein CO093_05070 [Alphaproteobacteria bacterium CG_4_9_14_3_um_filter_47_13]|nr:MAG: hypothetical protein CO093_05070 [Alphaproteobacteria bacterium CG_4_9_14_3_um_filter_47_13]
MAHYRFIHNLNDHSFSARQQGFVTAAGYLLSVHRYSPKFVEFAQTLNQDYDELIMADNGFFERIRLLIRHFSAESAALLEQVSALETTLGRRCRPGDMPQDIQTNYRILAKKVRDEVYKTEQSHELDFSAVLAEQALIQPDRQVCPEDILLASLVGLNIEPEYCALPRSFYRYRNERSARFCTFAKEGAWGATTGSIMAVASAADFNSAFDAGREMALAGHEHFAIGTGAYMADHHYTDHYRQHKKTVILERSVPRRYLRTILTTLGLVQGYKEVAGKPPAHIHLLGLGTPIIMLMTAWIGRDTQEISFDATSPIKDAVEGTIYVTDPSYLKFKTRKLAEFYAQNPADNWQCDCLYCQSYSKKYPMNSAKAAQWWEKNQPASLGREHLEDNTALAEALPLFAEPRNSPFLADISDWRMGHNHMMLERSMAAFNECGSAKDFKTLAEHKISAYINRSLPHYAYAIQHAWEMAS